MPEVACPGCGCASDDGLCTGCRPAARFLTGTVAEREAAVASATPPERGLLLLAVLRGWPSFGEAGPAALRRLATLAPNPTWDAFLAEDAGLGAAAWPSVARSEPARALTRAPVWFAPGRALDADAAKASFGEEPKRVYALAFRLGSAGVGADRQREVLAALPGGVAAIAEIARSYGGRFPSEDRWRPTAADLARAPGFRRLPLRVEGDMVLLCGQCAEPAGAGACTWCGHDGPNGRLDLYAFLNQREDCPVCGLDLAWAVRPSRCGGCLAALPRPSPA
jgi:hypothetical protein